MKNGLVLMLMIGVTLFGGSSFALALSREMIPEAYHALL